MITVSESNRQVTVRHMRSRLREVVEVVVEEVRYGGGSGSNGGG